MNTQPKITLRGSYGNLTVDAVTGAVLAYEDACWNDDREPDGRGEYSDIARADARDFAPGETEHDITAVGFWTIAGAYVAKAEG